MMMIKIYYKCRNDDDDDKTLNVLIIIKSYKSSTSLS